MAIGTYNETGLHRTLKELYACDGVTERDVEGYVCDVVREDGSIVEIQTAGLSHLKEKLSFLLPRYAVTVVHPIAGRTILRSVDTAGVIVSERKSPKKGTVYSVFRELTGIYPLLLHPHFTLEVMLVQRTELRRLMDDSEGEISKSNATRRRRRRKNWTVEDRYLDTAGEVFSFHTRNDYLALLPETLPAEFTAKELSGAGAGTHAGHMCWVLNKMCILKRCGSHGKAYLYTRA